MPKQDKEANPNQARGRETAPGQNQEVEFYNESTGERRMGTMNWFHDEGRDLGFRRAEEHPLSGTATGGSTVDIGTGDVAEDTE